MNLLIVLNFFILSSLLFFCGLDSSALRLIALVELITITFMTIVVVAGITQASICSIYTTIFFICICAIELVITIATVVAVYNSSNGNN